MEIMLIPSAGENQNSRVLAMGRSCPRTPGLRVVVSREPVVSTPAVLPTPRSSCWWKPEPLGSWPEGWTGGL